MSQILETAAGFLSSLAQHSYMNTEKTSLSILCFFFMSHYWGFIMYYEYIMQLLGSERLFTSFFPSFSHTSFLSLCCSLQECTDGYHWDPQTEHCKGKISILPSLISTHHLILMYSNNSDHPVANLVLTATLSA